MYTYDPNANKKNVDSENMNSLNEEDLFLAGGFDSFSEPNDNLNVGTPYMSGVEQYGVSQEAVNKWKPARVLSFNEQFQISFNPMKYDLYKSLTIADVKAFIKQFSHILVIVLMVELILYMNFSQAAKMTGVTGLNLFMIIFYLIWWGICWLIMPLSYRIYAWFYRLIAKLICMISGKNPGDDYLYCISVYPLVPAMMCGVIAILFIFGNVSLVQVLIVGAIASVSNLIPFIYMIIAILRTN